MNPMDDFKMRPGHSQPFWIFKKDAQIIAEYAQTKLTSATDDLKLETLFIQ